MKLDQDDKLLSKICTDEQVFTKYPIWQMYKI